MHVRGFIEILILKSKIHGVYSTLNSLKKKKKNDINNDLDQINLHQS